MSGLGLHGLLLREVAIFLAPLRELSEEGEAGVDRLLEEAGLAHLFGAEFEARIGDLGAALGRLGGRAEALSLIDPANAGLAELRQGVAALSDALGLAQPITDLADAIKVGIGATGPDDFDGLAMEPAEIADAVWRWLVWRWFKGLGPVARIAEFAGALAPANAGVGPRIRPERIALLARDPVAALADSIGWGGERLDIDPLFALVEEVAAQVGLITQFATVGEGPEARLALFVILAAVRDNGGQIEAGLRLSARQGAPAARLEITGFGSAGIAGRRAIEGTDFAIETEAAGEELPTLLIGPDEVALAAGAPPAGAITLSVGMTDPDGDRLLLLPFGNVGGVTAARISAGFTLDFGAAPAAGLEGRIEDGRIEVDPGDGDGFLALILPDQGIAAPFDITARYSGSDGLTLEGSGGLEIDIPVSAGLGEVLRLDAVHLALGAEEGGPILTLTVTGGVTLGPFKASVSRIGLAANVAPGAQEAETGAGVEAGSLIVDVAGLRLKAGFKPMEGLGLALDLGPISGGGYLALDPDEGRYAGAISLQAVALGLDAFGVVLTKLPDGSEGFSMLAFVRGRFAPIQLGFGFTLNSVGGIIGIHRDLDADALFASVRTGRAGELLSPEDPVSDAPRLIAQAEAIFPAHPGRHVFGPTLQLGWGVPQSLITLDLALAVNLPAPLRIVLIGRARAALPSPDSPIIAMNIDLAGVLDLGASTLEAEGQLFDSHYAGIPVQGGFALQTAWGRRRALAFSVGGLHPGFAPPAGFPSLPRAGISLSKSSNFSLQLLGYFAITSNSLQFGASIDFLAQIEGFGLEAHFGFDALIIFDPFGLDARIRASARLFAGGTTLMRLSLKGHLRGPGPWQVNGKVTFEILWVDISLGFSKSFGERIERDGERFDVDQLMREALQTAAHWRSDGENALVLTDTEGLVEQVDRLVFSQLQVPLGLALETFGGLPIDGARRFEILGLEVPGLGGVRLEEPPREAFAPGNFRDMDEAERLKAPAFEELIAGIAANRSALSRDGARAVRDASRRILRIDRDGPDGAPTFSEQPGWSPPEIILAEARRDSAPRVQLRAEVWRSGPLGQGGPAESYAEARGRDPGGPVHLDAEA